MNCKQLLNCLLTVTILLFGLTNVQAQKMKRLTLNPSGEDVILQWNRVLQTTIRTPGQHSHGENGRRLLSGRADGFLQNAIPLQNHILAGQICVRLFDILRPQIRQGAKQNRDCEKTI